ncbi:uncharacterized protein [Nicotiana tomentosiformis]|uniref:uncharacterized protein n=1 Tax=Nicotiana tomentosiformis TaxID=4098 RepID=UPI00388C5D9E
MLKPRNGLFVDSVQTSTTEFKAEGETIQEMYTRFTTLTNEFKSLGRVILEEDKVEKILTRVLLVSWESKITAIQESKNIASLRLDELIGNLTAYELRRLTMKMDVPKKERSLTLRITEGADLEEDEMAMITKDFKKYLKRGKGSSRGGNYNKARVPEKMTNEGCYKCGKTDHHIKNYPQWKIEWKKERSERRNMKKEQVHPKKNKGSIKAMVAAWGECSDEESDDEDGDEQALMEVGELDGESYEESEVSIIHLKDKIKFLSKEKLSELLLDFIDESKVHTFEANVLELKSENLKLKLGTSKKTADCTQLTLEENVGKLKDELYRKDEQEQYDEVIGLVKHLNETTAQTEASLEEGTGDGIGSSIPRNMSGGIEQNNSQTTVEPVPELVPQQQNTEGTSRGNQSSLKNLCAFDAFLSLIEPKNIAEALQDAD